VNLLKGGELPLRVIPAKRKREPESSLSFRQRRFFLATAVWIPAPAYIRRGDVSFAGMT